MSCDRLNEIPPGRLVDSLNRLGISKQTYTQGIKIYPIKTRSVEELLGEPGFLCGLYEKKEIRQFDNEKPSRIIWVGLRA